MLSSPIILYDFPAVAPESAGDFCDSTEIDEILALRVMTLTDEEKAEARGTDARAAAIIDRCDDMPDEIWSRLHGAVRSLRPVATVAEEPEPSRAVVGSRARRIVRSVHRHDAHRWRRGRQRHTRAPEAHRVAPMPTICSTRASSPR